MSKKTSSQVQQGQQKTSGKRLRNKAGINLSVWLGRAVLVLGCSALFVPAIANYDFYAPYIFFKSILFRGIVQVMMFIYVALAVTSPSYRPKLNRIHLGLIAYMAVMLVCSLPGISINARDSWWGDFSRMGGMISQLHLLAYFLVLSQTLRKERDWMVLFTASLFSGVAMGLPALIQKEHIDFVFRFEQYVRTDGTAGNPTFFASYLLLDLLIALYFIARKDRQELYPVLAKAWILLLAATDVSLIAWDFATGGAVLFAGLRFFPIAVFAFILHVFSFLWFAARRKVWSGLIFLIILCSYYIFWLNQSQTRAVLAGLAASLLFVALLYAIKGASRRIKLAALALILLLASLPFVVLHNRQSALVKSNPLLRRLTETSLTERRFLSWQTALEGLWDRPLLGWGLEGFHHAFDLHAPARIFLSTEEYWDDRAHNMLVDITTTTGAAGLLAYLSFYGIVFWFLARSWFRPKSDTLLISGFLLGYLVQDLFTFDTINTDVVVFMILAYVAYQFRREKEPEPAGVPATDLVRRSISSNGLAILGFTALILVLCHVYFVKRPVDANLLLNTGIVLETDKGSPQEGARYLYRESVLDSFEQADQYGTTGRHEVREQFANYASEVVKAPDIPVQDRARVAREAIALLDKSILEDPVDARHHMYFADMANAAFPVLNQTDPQLAISTIEKALSSLKKAEVFGPNRARVFLERTQALAYLGRTEEAIGSLKKALEIRPGPGLRSARFDMVALYISAGKYEEAQRGWQALKNDGQPPKSEYDRMIGLYVSKKKLEPALQLYNEQLLVSPDNPIILAHLATVYRELGDLESARNYALKAAAFDPKLAPQLQEFLKTLKK